MKSKHRTEVFFDKVSFTVPVVKSERLEVKDNIFQLFNSKPNNRAVNNVNSDPYDNDDCRVKHYRETNGRYNHTFDIDIPIHSNLQQGYFNFKVSIYPKNKSHNFIRFEFNPAKLGEDGERKLRRLLIKILGC